MITYIFGDGKGKFLCLITEAILLGRMYIETIGNNAFYRLFLPEFTHCWDSQAIAFSNLYASEHLIINVKDAEKWESFVENAGKSQAYMLPGLNPIVYPCNFNLYIKY